VVSVARSLASAMPLADWLTLSWCRARRMSFPPSLLLKRLPKAPAWTLADMACDAAEFRSTAQAMGAIPVVPSRKNARHPQSARTCPWLAHDRSQEPRYGDFIRVAFRPKQDYKDKV